MNIDIITNNSFAATFKNDETPDYVSLRQMRARESKNLGGEELILTSLSIAAGVPVGVFANWLWSKLNASHLQHKAVRKFTVDYTEIKFHQLKKDEFVEIIERKITIKR